MPSEWERMTPQELNLYAYARRDELQSQRAVRCRTVYDMAALIRTAVWGKEFPSFEEVFPDEQEATEESDDKIYAAVRALNALMGGREE